MRYHSQNMGIASQCLDNLMLKFKTLLILRYIRSYEFWSSGKSTINFLFTYLFEMSSLLKKNTVTKWGKLNNFWKGFASPEINYLRGLIDVNGQDFWFLTVQTWTVHFQQAMIIRWWQHLRIEKCWLCKKGFWN